ncbi:hypothetical protein HN51_062500 [Arachis hypogaea]
MWLVSIDTPDTLPIIYERHLFGITYPRSYDFLHVDYLFSRLKKMYNFQVIVAKTDQILRPESTLIVRDTAEVINELESMVKSMNWEVCITYIKENEDFLGVRKSTWWPTKIVTLEYVV